MQSVMPALSLYGPDLVGILMSPVIEILNKDIAKEKTTERFLASMAICFVVAFLLKWNQVMAGSPEELIASFGIIFTESQVVYKLYFKDSFIRAKIQERLAPTPEEEPLG